MKQFDIKILAIESSCDETAAAVVSGDGKNSPTILSSVVSSQVDLHAKTGGVVPEVASRAHVEAIVPVIKEALIKACQQVSKSAGQLKQDESSAVQLSSCPADMLKNEITHIAVTSGPGLIGSLLVGFNAAKTLAYALDKPVVPINHIEGHIYSALVENSKIVSDFDIRRIEFPVLALVVSGGHSSLILMRDHGQYELIGQTLDDAAGEAFDKVAQLLGLGYPGGPAVSKITSNYREKYQSPSTKVQTDSNIQNSKQQFNNLTIKQLIFPRPILNDGTFNFSFSGLKTAVLSEVKRRLSELPRPHSEVESSFSFPSPIPMGEGRGEGLSGLEKAEIATAFEDAAVDVLVAKTMRAIEKFKPKTVVLAGGVAANRHLRESLSIAIQKYCSRLGAENSVDVENKDFSLRLKNNCDDNINLLIPPLELCGDNAAMIGLAAYYNILNGQEKRWNEIDVDSNWEIG